MASSGGRVGNSRQSQSNSMALSCQRDGSEHSYSLNSLWSIWYCTLAMAFQVYIIANSIKRFTLYLSLPWPNGQPPFSSLNAYVVLIGTGVVMLPFFVVVAMMKVGNYSNDGHKLGYQRKTYESTDNNIYQNIKITEREMRRKRRFHALKLIWRHLAPIAPLLHMLAALCFLIPRILMEAQLIKHGFLGKGDIWKTEIDFILSRLEDKKISILGFLNTISDSERNQLNLETYSLNQYLTKQSSNLVKQYDVPIEESGHLSMELINFAISLCVLAVRYPSVFWKVHKGFGFFLSIQLILNLIHSLITYCAFQVTLKVLVCDPNLVLVRFKSLSNLTPFQLTFIFISYIILLTLSSAPLYMYGLQKYREWRSSQSRTMHITLGPQKQRLCGYLSHFCAFIALVSLAVCVFPLIYEFVIIYCGSLDSSILIAIFSTAFHMLFWIIVWLFLTIKNKWHFDMTFDYENENKYNLIDKYNRKCMPYARGDTPLLVIENGKTYQIRETASKRAILGVAHKSHITQRPTSPTEDEDIYWLKPKLSTPNKVLNKELSPEGNCSMTWLKNDTKSNNKVSFEGDGNSTGSKTKKKNKTKSPKNTLKNKKNKGKENGIDFDQMSDHSDGDYATLRKIMTNDIENRDLTHLSLCPLRNESIELQKCQMNASLEGEYEMLVDSSYSMAQNRNPNNCLLNESPINYSTNVCHNMTSTPLTVAAHFGREEHNADQLTPRSGSISETSTSPEKNSDTSSGVHSNSSNGTNSITPSGVMNNNRSSSMESIMNQIQVAAAASKPSFRSLSLQRYMSSLPEQTHINTIPQRMSSFNESDQTLVIRRTKRPQRTSDIFNMKSTGTTKSNTYFGRDANFRMTSFTENPEYMRFHSMPTQPKMVPIPAVPTQMPTQTSLANNEYSLQTYSHSKPYLTNSLNSHVITGIQRPVVSIAPQVMAINGSHNFLQQREQTNYSFAPQSNLTAQASQIQTM